MPFDAKFFEEKTLEEMKSSSSVTSPSICLVSADTTKAWKRWTEANSIRRAMATRDNKVVAAEKKEVKEEMSVAEIVRQLMRDSISGHSCLCGCRSRKDALSTSSS